MKAAVSLLLLLAPGFPLACQTLAVHSAATAGASAAATGMDSVGKAAASALGKAGAALQSGAQVSPGAKPAPGGAARAKTGMTAREVLALLGPPASKTETWTYGAGADAVTLTLRGGKVTAISQGEQPERAAPPDPADVVIVQ